MTLFHFIGEWWNSDIEEVIKEALETGAGYNISDALTINGQPGDLYSCSQGGSAPIHLTPYASQSFKT